MSLLNFTINNKNSFNDFNLYIKTSNHENLPKKRYESIPIPGRTGNLIIEEDAKDNQIIDIECYAKLGNTSPQLYGMTLIKWLTGFNGYGQLIFNDGYQFEAKLSQDIEVERMDCGWRSIKLQFEAIPIDPTSSKYVIANETNKVMLTDDTRGIEVVN